MKPGDVVWLKESGKGPFLVFGVKEDLVSIIWAEGPWVGNEVVSHYGEGPNHKWRPAALFTLVRPPNRWRLPVIAAVWLVVVAVLCWGIYWFSPLRQQAQPLVPEWTTEEP